MKDSFNLNLQRISSVLREFKMFCVSYIQCIYIYIYIYMHTYIHAHIYVYIYIYIYHYRGWDLAVVVAMLTGGSIPARRARLPSRGAALVPRLLFSPLLSLADSQHPHNVYMCTFTLVYTYVYVYVCIYIYIYISRPRGDRKLGGCFCLGLLGRRFR